MFARAFVPATMLACGIAGSSQAADLSPDLTPPLDVSVSGDPDVIRNLSAGDFVVTLNGKKTPVASAEARCQLTEGEPPPNATQFFMYFNQRSMSLDGRHRSILIAEALIPKLIVAGEVAIVANGLRLRMLAPPTSDGPTLLRILEKFDQDENRWEVKPDLYDVDVKVPQSADSLHDPVRADRLAVMMSAFSAFGPPKVVLHFAEYGAPPERAAAYGGFRIHTIASGASSSSYKALARMASDSGGCIQLRDKFAEGKLEPGLYTYRVRVLADGKEIDTAKRLFAAVAPTH